MAGITRTHGQRKQSQSEGEPDQSSQALIASGSRISVTSITSWEERAVLQDLHDDLVDALPTNDVIPRMYAKQLITEKELQEVQAANTQSKQNSLLLQSLGKRKKGFLETFTYGVLKPIPGQDHIIDALQKGMRAIFSSKKDQETAEPSHDQAPVSTSSSAVIVNELQLSTEVIARDGVHVPRRTSGPILFTPSETPSLLKAEITWEECPEVPVPMAAGNATYIDGKVYFGGGYLDTVVEHGCNVYCFDSSKDVNAWSQLQALPVSYFGLGQVQGHLVAVGGQLQRNGKTTNLVHTYNSKEKRWDPCFVPSMPTPRESATVISHHRALVVAGGDLETSKNEHTDTVEIYNVEKREWFKTDPLPKPCRNPSFTIIRDVCYLLGGCQHPGRSNQSLCASVPQLLENAEKPIGITRNGPQAWKELADTPTYRPTAAVIANRVLAIGGGSDSSKASAAQDSVYMYFPSDVDKPWKHIGGLPANLKLAAAAELSQTEVVVIGGQTEGDELMNIVYKGTLDFFV